MRPIREGQYYNILIIDFHKLINKTTLTLTLCLPSGCSLFMKTPFFHLEPSDVCFQGIYLGEIGQGSGRDPGAGGLERAAGDRAGPLGKAQQAGISRNSQLRVPL